jgi:hypothetical protein
MGGMIESRNGLNAQVAGILIVIAFEDDLMAAIE